VFCCLSPAAAVQGEIAGQGKGKKAKVALVIDDFGQSNISGVKEMLALDRPITLAVMPYLEYTDQHAKEGAKLGHEVIVHLPMQPVKGKASWLGPGAITCDMTPEEVIEQVRKDFAQVPQAKGFNNHMGSLITSREVLVRPVLEVAREMNFFVLDSKTTGDSMLIPLARSMGIPYAQRDIFLDDQKSIAHVQAQLEQLANVALANGSAVGIGHVGLGGEQTAQAIKAMIPVMEAKGIEFVYLSLVINQPSVHKDNQGR
jgi:polysaccharide deacetylase 2 family uncharacterized protein YibQ